MKNSGRKFFLVAILLTAAALIFVHALNNRYQRVAGIIVLDRWTNTMMTPDSTGKLIPFRK